MHKHGTNHREKCLVKREKVNPLGYPRRAYERVHAATTSAPKARVPAHAENSTRQAVPVCCFDRNTTESWPKYSQQRRPTKGGSTTTKKGGNLCFVRVVSFPSRVTAFIYLSTEVCKVLWDECNLIRRRFYVYL